MSLLKRQNRFSIQIPMSLIVDKRAAFPRGSLYAPINAKMHKFAKKGWFENIRADWLWPVLVYQIQMQKTNRIVLPTLYLGTIRYGNLIPKHFNLRLKSIFRRLRFKDGDKPGNGVDVVLSKKHSVPCSPACPLYDCTAYHGLHYEITVPACYLGALHDQDTAVLVRPETFNTSAVYRYSHFFTKKFHLENAGAAKELRSMYMPTRVYAASAGFSYLETKLINYFLGRITKTKARMAVRRKPKKYKDVPMTPEGSVWFKCGGLPYNEENDVRLLLLDAVKLSGFIWHSDKPVTEKSYENFVKALAKISKNLGMHFLFYKLETLELVDTKYLEAAFGHPELQKQILENVFVEVYVPESYRRLFRAKLLTRSGHIANKATTRKDRPLSPHLLAQENLDFLVVVAAKMKENNISKKDLAKRSGVSYQTICKIFRNEEASTQTTKNKIRKSLNLDY